MKFEKIGTVYGHPDAEIVRLEDGRYIVLNDWNGEKWFDCWFSDKLGIPLDGSGDESFTVIPGYRFQELGVAPDDSRDDFDELIEIVSLAIE